MRYLLFVLCLMILSQPAFAADLDPRSKKTLWRIPSNAAVTAVGEAIQWRGGEEADGTIVFDAGLGKHHSYEQAWAYYAHVFGLKTNYDTTTRQQVLVIDGDKRTATENDRDHIFKAGRWARMHGNFGRYETSLSLWDDPTLAQKMGTAYAVSVRIRFEPK